MSIKISLALTADLPRVVKMASVAFRATYEPILSEEQIEYMFAKMYNINHLKEQQQIGYSIFILTDNGNDVGYMQYHFLENEMAIRLDKLYLIPERKGKGYGSKLFNFLEQIAIKNKAKFIELNVHRKNPSMYFYKKIGFKLDEKVDIAFGCHTLCDYILKKYYLYLK